MAIADNAPDEAAMLRKGRLIAAKLEEVYPEAPAGFLHHSDAFTLLVAVLLSAQSLDKKVNAVTPALFAAAPTPAAMRRLGEARIRDLIREVGLSPQKAANLARLSAILEDEHAGHVPASFAALEALPGVGHKTASVVMMQAFGHPAFPVDTHIHRLACRWGAGDPRSVDRTEAALKRWFPDPAAWQDLHVRIILFGREHCPARKHDMDTCPVCSFAATDEARAANAASPNKFVAAKSHKFPFAVREVGTDHPGGAGGVDVGTPKPPAKQPPRKKSARSAAAHHSDSYDDFQPAPAKNSKSSRSSDTTSRKRTRTVASGDKKPAHPAAKKEARRQPKAGDDPAAAPIAKRRKTTAKASKTKAKQESQDRSEAAQSEKRQSSGVEPTAVRSSARIRARKKEANGSE